MPSAETKEVVALIAPGVEFEGRIRASRGTVTLDSHFKGTVESEATLVVGEQGDVEAEITARTVTVSGKVKGAVHATELLEIKASGAVFGDIWTPVLAVAPGGYFEGQCHMPAPETNAIAAPSGTGGATMSPARTESAAVASATAATDPGSKML